MFAYSNLTTTSALSDLDEPQGEIALDQTADSVFDPRPHFGRWLQALEGFRNRGREICPGVYLQDGDRDFAETLALDEQLPDQACSEGTLVVTEQGRLQADVEVSVAVIDGLFKGKIKATEQVVLENHALVIGEINTPILTIRGGAIIEGRCYFQPSEQIEAPLERWERPGWQAFKVGFAKVWRSRIFE
jgi:cytoskeletal protein CcmA (bactofilin family)